MNLPWLSAAQFEVWAGFVIGNWVLQSSLLLVLCVTVASLPRLSAGVRHTLALCGLILAAVSPLALAIPHPVAARVEAPTAVKALTGAASQIGVVPPRSMPASSKPVSPNLATLFALAWAVGCAVRLLWLIGGSAQVAAWLRRSRPVDVRRIVECCGYEAVDLDIRTTNDLNRPAVAGVLRPAILLPTALLDMAGNALRPVLLHEGAHYRRRDPLRLLLAEMAGALLFWHPLAWALRLQLDRLAEEACDREVLAKGVAPADYARTLVDLLAPSTGRRIALACSLGRGGRELQRRIDALFHIQRQPHGAATACVVALVVPALAGALSIQAGSRPVSPSSVSRHTGRPQVTVRPFEPTQVASIKVRRKALPMPVATRAVATRATLPLSITPLRQVSFEPVLASSHAREPMSGQVVVFLLDISTSMRPYQDAARRDLLDRVTALRAGDTFNVVAFATEQHRYAPDPVAADEATREGVESWLTTLPQASGTCPLPALELALATPGAGSVVLISDKQTATGELALQVESLVRERNASHATVLAVTLGEPAASGVPGIPSPMGIVERVVAAEEAVAPL